jgi:hypothetical protein
MGKFKIAKVYIEHVVDDSADTSCLGHYTDSPKEVAEACGYAIVREYGKFVVDIDEDTEKIHLNGNEYRYFIPAQHVPHDPKNWDHVSEEDKNKCIAEHGSLKETDEYYAMMDYERMERLEDGDWCYIGIVAMAEIVGESDVIQTIRSGGVYGIESDSDKEYLIEVEQQELIALSGELIDLGIEEDEIDEAIENKEYENS